MMLFSFDETAHLARAWGVEGKLLPLTSVRGKLNHQKHPGNPAKFTLQAASRYP